MKDVIDAIEAAVAADATPEVRAAGVAACRAILAALDATSNVPPPPLTLPPSPVIAELVAAVRRMPPDQLLDLAIAKLRAALPTDAAPSPPVAAPKFRIIQLPPHLGGGRP